MSPTQLTLGLSSIDEERFGIRSARASGLTVEALPGVIEFCQQNDVKFLVARCPVHELPAAQAMEGNGFILMDTLLYFARQLMNVSLPPIGDMLQIRSAHSHEAQEIGNLAAQVFQNYGGHYHADPRLDRQACDDVYASWAYRSCISREVADEVLVAELQGKAVGFITLKMRSQQEGEAPLYGVAPSMQGQGIGRDLMIEAMHWFASRGVENDDYVDTGH